MKTINSVIDSIEFNGEECVIIYNSYHYTKGKELYSQFKISLDSLDSAKESGDKTLINHFKKQVEGYERVMSSNRIDFFSKSKNDEKQIIKEYEEKTGIKIVKTTLLNYP